MSSYLGSKKCCDGNYYQKIVGPQGAQGTPSSQIGQLSGYVQNIKSASTTYLSFPYSMATSTEKCC